MSSLIVLAIGPVQGYIKQARRTQDLWQSSRILSYLASQGVRAAMGEGLAEVIYPAIADGQTDNVPNQMVVLWNGDEAGARACAHAMERAIRAAWEQISQNTFSYLQADNTWTKVKEIWSRQERDWMECYWIVVPYDVSRRYADNIGTANLALGSRKILRNFPQINEEGLKCSITGEHEALHEGDPRVFWSNLRAEQRNLALLGKSERLSAISAVKRFAHEDRTGNHELQFPNRLPSTSSIAVIPFRYGILDAIQRNGLPEMELRKAVSNYMKILAGFFTGKIEYLFFTRSGKYNPEYFGKIGNSIQHSVLQDQLVQEFRSIDGDFLFEDTLIRRTIEEYGGSVDGHSLDNARKALKALVEKAAACGIAQPQPYFAIVAMDGDRMGEVLGRLLDKNQHLRFSSSLADFARTRVKDIVETHNLGRVIYAGGDDVLALLPVSGALAIVEELRKAFTETIRLAGIIDQNSRIIEVHLSAGLAYVHHTHNLQHAIEAAQAAQDRAKNQFGRNAVAVSFLRRSGEPRYAGGKWETGRGPLLDIVSRLATAFSNGLSRRLPYDVAQIAYSMGGPTVPNDAIRAEVGRVIRRRFAGVDDNVVTAVQEDLIELTRVLLPSVEAQWRNAEHWLELARFISQRESPL